MNINQNPGLLVPDRISVGVVSDEASVTIPVGTPVCLTIDGTDDGLAVVLPSNAAAKAHAYAFGVATAAIAPSARGAAAVFGFVPNIVLLRQTRAASTDSFASIASIGTGVMLAVDTVNNAFQSSGGTLAVTQFLPFAVIAASVASAASSASATSDTRTAITISSKAFVRMM